MQFGPRSVVARFRGGLTELRGDGRGWALLAIGVGWFFVLGLRFVVPALLPTITTDFGISDASAGLAITLLWVSYAAVQFPAGALGDWLGERTLLAVSTLGAAVAIGGYVVSLTFGIFLVATAAFGLTTGLYGPSRGTALSRLYLHRDGEAFGLVLAAGSLGSAILPPLAALATDFVGWRGALGLSVPGLLCTALALWWAVPGEETRGQGSRTAASDGDGTRSLTALRHAVASRDVLLALVGTSIMLFVFQGLSAFFTTYLVRVKGLGELSAGLLFGLLFVSGALSQWRGGSLADRYGHARVLSTVSLVSVLPLLALPVAGGFWPVLLVALGLGVRLAVAPMANSYIVALLPPAVRGSAWGAIRTGMFTVSAFGSTLVGAMADADRFTEALLLLAVLTAIAGGIYRYLPEREPV